jgi:hypothetical protein
MSRQPRAIARSLARRKLHEVASPLLARLEGRITAMQLLRDER